MQVGLIVEGQCDLAADLEGKRLGQNQVSP